MNEIRISGLNESTCEGIAQFYERWRILEGSAHCAEMAMEGARDCYEITIGGYHVPVTDDSRPILLEFLTKAKVDLQRQARNMELVVKVGAEAETEEEEDDDGREFEIPAL